MVPHPVRLAALAASFVVLGCGNSNPVVSDPDASAPSGDASMPTGDGKSATRATGKTSTGPGDWGPGDYPPELEEQKYLTIKGVDGQDGNVRGYKVHVPPSYDASKPMPMLFALHGLGQNAVMFAIDGAKWPQKSDAEGFILVMPTGNLQNSDGTWGTTGSWNAGECCGAAAQSGLDDVALIRAIAKEVGSHVNVDLTRVYATGFSNGGFLSYRLACEASDLFVAIAPGSGAIGTPQIAPLGVGNQDFTNCAPQYPISVLEMHGTADPLVNYNFVKPSLDHMAQANGCSLDTSPAKVPSSGGDTTCVTYANCPSGIEVTGCTVDGGGHCWFGDPTCGTGDTSGVAGAIVGANSDTLVDTDAAWSFLKRFSY